MSVIKQVLIMKMDEKNLKGFSTLELLMAMGILILILTAVVLVSFSNQSILIDSQTNSEALSIAQGLLEKAQADTRKDFNLVNPIAATTTPDGFIYQLNVKQTDYFTKLVTATVDFPEDSGRRGKTSLSAVVANFNNAVGGDTCSSVILPNAEAWKIPQIKSSFSGFSSLAGITDSYPITDIDAYKGKLYVTVNNSSAVASTTPTFFVFNIDSSDPNNPKIAKIDNDYADNDIENQSGLNAVAVAEDPASTASPKPVYAYVANASGASTVGQFQVIDVSGPVPEVKKSLKLPKVSGSQSVGNSIFYKNGYVYLGLKATASGPEFHIIDVHNPLAPSPVGYWPASGNLNHDINAIYVSGRYAYLATPDSKNLIVLDISNASAPIEVGSFSDGGGNNGKSLFLAGDTLYLGRTVGGTELSILDQSIPATTTPPILGLKSDINKSVDGIIVRGKTNLQNASSSPALAFFVTPSDFRVLDVSDSSNIGSWGTKSFVAGTFGNSLFEPVFDCEGNNFFVGSNSSSKDGFLSIIAP